MFIKTVQKFLKVKQTGYFDETTRRAWKNYCFNARGMSFYANVIPNTENLPKDFYESLFKKQEAKKTKPVKVLEKPTESPVEKTEPKAEEKQAEATHVATVEEKSEETKLETPVENTELKAEENPILPEETKPTLSELAQETKPTIVYGDPVIPTEPVGAVSIGAKPEPDGNEKKEKRKKNK